MNFEDVLNDIEKLIGKPLQAINPQTDSIEVIEINRETQNFYVTIGKGKAKSRPISLIKTIWEELSHHRVANAEAIQGGSGSSRHVPETILANLPYVEYFKYNRKKHLYLNTGASHELGTIQEAGASDVRKIKSILDNSNQFDYFSFATDFEHALNLLTQATKDIRIKFPGEFEASTISDAETQLTSLLEIVNGTFLTPISTDSNTFLNDEERDRPEEIGIEGISEKEVEGDEDIIESDNQDTKESPLTASRIRQVYSSISLIYDRLLHNDIELQPDFQRKDRIWPLAQKSALIESILMGIPIPSFYFAERPNGNWLIVDGLQRATTIFDFIANEFQLSGLSFLKDLNDLRYEELSRPDQRKIREFQLHCHVITITNQSDVIIRELFRRINTYGSKMSYQEIRCALHPGHSVKFIRYLAENAPFKKATFYKVKPDRMRDMELILGALAFILFGFEEFESKKFDDFLTKSMKKLNKYKLRVTWPEHDSSISEEQNREPTWHVDGTDPIYKNLREKIESAFSLSEQIFGDDRFKKEQGGKIISKPLFELIVSTFALLSANDQKLLLNKKDEVKAGLYGLLSGTKEPYVKWSSDTFIDRDFEYSVSQSTGKRVTILYRFQNFKALLEDVLDKKITIKGILESDDKID